MNVVIADFAVKAVAHQHSDAVCEHPAVAVNDISAYHGVFYASGSVVLAAQVYRAGAEVVKVAVFDNQAADRLFGAQSGAAESFEAAGDESNSAAVFDIDGRRRQIRRRLARGAVGDIPAARGKADAFKRDRRSFGGGCCAVYRDQPFNPAYPDGKGGYILSRGRDNIYKVFLAVDIRLSRMAQTGFYVFEMEFRSAAAVTGIEAEAGFGA